MRFRQILTPAPLGALLLTALLATACGSDGTSVSVGDDGDGSGTNPTTTITGDGDPAVSEPGSEASTLLDTPWRFVQAVVGGDAVVPVEKGQVATITFSGEEFTGNAGCNDFMGSFTFDEANQQVTITDLAIQEIACEDRTDWLSVLDLGRTWQLEFSAGDLDLIAVDGSGAEFRMTPFEADDPSIDKEFNPLADAIAEEIVGLTEAEAIAKAEADGRAVRVVMRDGEAFPVTLDFNPDRVNLTVNDNIVTAVELG